MSIKMAFVKSLKWNLILLDSDMLLTQIVFMLFMGQFMDFWNNRTLSSPNDSDLRKTDNCSAKSIPDIIYEIQVLKQCPGYPSSEHHISIIQ
ncbi:hypothetical protein TNCV_1353711 [Trichonephila clavipes]|nr:hypothetical protein TNCV_1353711 [Trichonephila clavipes]